MNLPEFCLLNEPDQIDLLYREGTYIGKRKEGKTTLVLYQLNGFYIELCYYKYRQLIAWMRYSESMQILDPYLDKMDIAALVVNGED